MSVFFRLLLVLLSFGSIYNVSVGQDVAIEIKVAEIQVAGANCFIVGSFPCEHFFQPVAGPCASVLAEGPIPIIFSDGTQGAGFICGDGNELVNGSVPRVIPANQEAPFGRTGPHVPLEADNEDATILCGKILHCNVVNFIDDDTGLASARCEFAGTFNPVLKNGHGLEGDSCNIAQPGGPVVDPDLGGPVIEATVDPEHVGGQ